MAERHRSKDGSRDTDQYATENDAPAQSGRDGGNLQRDVATQDERKRAEDGPEGTTRVSGEDKRNHGENK